MDDGKCIVYSTFCCRATFNKHHFKQYFKRHDNQFFTDSLRDDMWLIFGDICFSYVTDYSKIIRLGHMWSMLPFIMLGNIALVLIWHYVGNRKIKDRTILSYLIATVLSSVVKFCILYFTIAKFLVPIILNLPQTQASIISASFSTVQILTSTIGGIVAVLFLPLMKKALRGKIYE